MEDLKATPRPPSTLTDDQAKKRLRSRINNDHTYHRPPPEIAPNFVTIRDKAKELALLMVDLCPMGRELSSALTNLEQSVMHANAGIARQYPVEAS